MGKKKVLVTGCDGFTGRYVRAEFEQQGYEILGLVRDKPNTPTEITCDLTNKSAISNLIHEHKPDGVIHLAAISFVAHEDQSAFYGVNVIGTTNLLEAMEAASLTPDKFIVASSANVYGNPKVEKVSESTPPEPINHYAASKLAMEYMVKTWYERYPIIITRPFNYTGPGQDENFLVPKIVNHYRQEQQCIELGNLDVARDFSDVRDVARAYLELYESPADSEIVNISSGTTYKLGEILNLMSDIAGYSPKIDVNPKFVRANEIRLLCGDNAKLKALVNFAPCIPFKKTLNDMFTFQSTV